MDEEPVKGGDLKVEPRIYMPTVPKRDNPRFPIWEEQVRNLVPLRLQIQMDGLTSPLASPRQVINPPPPSAVKLPSYRHDLRSCRRAPWPISR
jgi:hypothetical protein